MLRLMGEAATSANFHGILFKNIQSKGLNVYCNTMYLETQKSKWIRTNRRYSRNVAVGCRHCPPLIDQWSATPASPIVVGEVHLPGLGVAVAFITPDDLIILPPCAPHCRTHNGYVQQHQFSYNRANESAQIETITAAKSLPKMATGTRLINFTLQATYTL